jgi:hypothetical protein
MLVAQMAAVHAAAMRCLARAAECATDPKIEALYLREAARLLHLFQRQSETLDRRARRPGPAQAAAEGPDEAEDAAAKEAAKEAAGWRVLDMMLADIDARRREKAEAEGEALGEAGDGGRGRGGTDTAPPG